MIAIERVQYVAMDLIPYVAFFFVALGLIRLVAIQTYAQIEVKQSVTTNDNGQSTSIKTEAKAPANICLGLPSACEPANCLGMTKDCTGASLFMKLLQGGTVKLTEKPGQVTIQYCSLAKQCHTYRLAANRTLSEVKQSK